MGEVKTFNRAYGTEGVSTGILYATDEEAAEAERDAVAEESVLYTSEGGNDLLEELTQAYCADERAYTELTMERTRLKGELFISDVKIHSEEKDKLIRALAACEAKIVDAEEKKKRSYEAYTKMLHKFIEEGNVRVANKYEALLEAKRTLSRHTAGE